MGAMRVKVKLLTIWQQKADAVVRYSGGSNAGHTVVVNNINYKLRLLPSGVLFNDKTNVLGQRRCNQPRRCAG